MAIVLPVIILAYYYPGLAQARPIYTMLRIPSQSGGGGWGEGVERHYSQKNQTLHPTLLNHPHLTRCIMSV